MKVFKIIGGWRLDDDDDDDSSSSSSSSRRFFNSRSHQTVGAQHAHAGPANVNESGLVVVVVIFATFAALLLTPSKDAPSSFCDNYLGF